MAFIFHLSAFEITDLLQQGVPENVKFFDIANAEANFAPILEP
jgi:hypothetical protein